MIKKSLGFTVIELIITMVIIGVIAAIAGTFFVPMANLFFYLPSQMSVEQTAQDIVYISTEGDHNAEGLRYAKSISSADEDDITFITQEDDTVNLRWDATAQRLYRNINSGGENLIPARYYGDIIAKGAASASEFFKYYDSSASQISSPVATPTSIESIRMNIIVQSATGKVKDNRGRVEINTGVDIKQY